MSSLSKTGGKGEEKYKLLMGVKILQVNLGKGKAAGELLRGRVSEMGVDVVLVQEPYARDIEWKGFKRFRKNEKSKAEIWVSESMRGAEGWTKGMTENVACVKVILRDGREIMLVSVYDEPGGRENKRIAEVEKALRDWRAKGVIIGGDLNAKNEAWGGGETDARGEKLMEWMTEKGLVLENDSASGATFSSTRGNSWVDVTMSRGVVMNEWRVEDEETLSDHRYITYQVVGRAREEGTKTRYDFENADWESFRSDIAEYEEVERMHDLEEEIRAFAEHCHAACRRHVRKIVVYEGNERWWNGRLEGMRRSIKRKRRRWQEEREADAREILKEEYRRERREYKKAIERERKLALENQLQEICDRDPWDKVWQLIRRPINADGEGMIRREDGTYTRNRREKDEYLLEKYFPRVDERGREEWIKERRERVREFNRENDREFEEWEVQEVVNELRKGKAVGDDRIPNEAMKEIVKVKCGLLTRIYNECLRRGTFPRIWKKANVSWIPKRNGDPRPISLLPTLGKVLDRLINRRIQRFLEVTGQYDREQYGFRSGRDTVMGIRRMTEVIERNKREGRHSMVVALDLSNAFNMAWEPSIDEEMEKMNMYGNLRRICGDFMRDRSVRSGRVKMEIDRGCPQGSSLGPTLWLIVMEGWFRRMRRVNEEIGGDERDEGQTPGSLCHAQAFADDQVIVISGESVKKIERRWERVREACEEWERENLLKYNTRKTEAMFVGMGGRIREPRIRMGGEFVDMGEELRVLGVVIDRTFKFIDHVKSVRKRVGESCTRIIGMLRRRYGVNELLIRTLYERVIRVAVLYGVEIWGSRIRDSRIIRQLRATQRLVLLSLQRAYRTTPTAALEVISGLPPLEVVAECEYQLAVGKRVDKERVGEHWPHPAFRVDVDKEWTEMRENEGVIRVYTDASGDQEGKVGIGVWMEGAMGELCKSERLRNKTPIIVAEGRAVGLALRMIVEKAEDVGWERLQGERIVIMTDCLQTLERINSKRQKGEELREIRGMVERLNERGVGVRLIWRKKGRGNRGNIRAETVAREGRDREEREEEGTWISEREKKEREKQKVLEMWQGKWENEASGRTLYGLCPEVGYEPLGLSFKGAQLATGHGNLLGYLRRFRLRDVDGECECGRGQEDSEHVRYACGKDDRMEGRRAIEEKWGDLEIRLRMDKRVRGEDVRKLNEWAEKVLEDENWGVRGNGGSDDESSDG